MISVFRSTEQELNEFMMKRILRDPSRSGGLICYAQIEPMRLPELARRHSSRRYRRRCAEHLARRRTYRDLN